MLRRALPFMARLMDDAPMMTSKKPTTTSPAIMARHLMAVWVNRKAANKTRAESRPVPSDKAHYSADRATD